MTEFLDGFLDDYFAECDEHLTAVRQALLALESSVGLPRPDASVTEELFRSFHSLKGIAGMVEHRETELLAHEMESYLRAIREGDVLLTSDGVDALIAGAQALEDTIAAHHDKHDAPDTSAVLGRLRALVADGAEAEPVHPQTDTAQTPTTQDAWECVFTPSAALVARGINVDAVRARLREYGEIMSALPIVADQGVAFRFLFQGNPDAGTIATWAADGMSCARSAPAAVATHSAPDEEEVVRPGARLSSRHVVRVDLARLDELMRMIGDLVILRGRLADSLTRIEPHVPPSVGRAVQEHAAAIERQLRELREGVMRVRLVPVGEIFRRMPFVVRDLARETGRRVGVAIEGQDTEIDKFLVERMMDPVLHLVRNSVSHGIESAEERVAAGKPAEGTLTLRASAAGEIVTIEIADDGHGVDAARVVDRARRAGLPVPAQLDDAALLDLISAPGFSTREESDRVSGRGFGMAVVRDTVRDLGGTIRMTSVAGRGTAFSIDLPLTLAIVDALVARVGSQTFAVPQAAVREVVHVEASAIRMLEDGEVTIHRGAPLPVIRLARVLGTPSAEQTSFNAFVIGERDAAVALLADRIVGQREIVVRPTADPLIRIDGISGATDLGDGRAVLILDAPALTRLARRQGPRRVPTPLRDTA